MYSYSFSVKSFDNNFHDLFIKLPYIFEIIKLHYISGVAYK